MHRKAHRPAGMATEGCRASLRTPAPLHSQLWLPRSRRWSAAAAAAAKQLLSTLLCRLQVAGVPQCSHTECHGTHVAETCSQHWQQQGIEPQHAVAEQHNMFVAAARQCLSRLCLHSRRRCCHSKAVSVHALGVTPQKTVCSCSWAAPQRAVDARRQGLMCNSSKAVPQREYRLV